MDHRHQSQQASLYVVLLLLPVLLLSMVLG